MNILITRPSPYGKQLVNQLNRIGKKAYHLPLITFAPGIDLPLLEQYLKKLSNQDLLFIMSQTAIKYAHDWLSKSKTTWPQKVYYYAIGHATALKTYKSIKIASITYPKTQENTEGLLELLKHKKHSLTKKQALIICGQGSRKMLKRTLKKQGVHVTTCESYERIPIFYNGEEKIKHMIKIGINTIVITSKEILQHLHNLTPNHYKINWLTQCTLIVISERIANYAQKLGWRNIIVINNPTKNNHLLNLLTKI